MGQPGLATVAEIQKDEKTSLKEEITALLYQVRKRKPVEIIELKNFRSPT